MSICNQAQFFVGQIKNIGKLNEDREEITMSDLLDMICCAAETWHYNQDDSFNVLFEDKSCVRVLENSFHIIEDFDND